MTLDPGNNSHKIDTPWTIDSLKIYLESEINQTNDKLTAAIQALRREREITSKAQDVAVAKAETATERRFEAANEFRAQLTEQATKFLPREVADAQLTELKKSFETQINELRKQSTQNTERLNTAQGREIGSVSTKAAVMGFVLALASIVAIISPHIH